MPRLRHLLHVRRDAQAPSSLYLAQFRSIQMTQPQPGRQVVLLLAVCITLLCAVHIWRSLTPQTKPRLSFETNVLAIGSEAAARDVIAINCAKPVPLNFMTKAQVLNLRREAVLLYPTLIKGSYAPAVPVFGQIEDGLPWWGTVGGWYFYHVPGESSILGPAEQSRCLLNPYLLVAADVRTETVNGDDWRWDTNKATEADALNGRVPLVPHPTDLRWMPARCRADVTYHVTQFVADANPYMLNKLRDDRAVADLTAYNARDFGLHYIYVSYKDSTNVSKERPPAEAYDNPQFLHRGMSCGYPGGCNNRSPTTPVLDDLKLSPLPATLTVLLWHRKPDTVTDAPDFTFFVHFD